MTRSVWEKRTMIQSSLNCCHVLVLKGPDSSWINWPYAPFRWISHASGNKQKKATNKQIDPVFCSLHPCRGQERERTSRSESRSHGKEQLSWEAKRIWWDKNTETINKYMNHNGQFNWPVWWRGGTFEEMLSLVTMCYSILCPLYRRNNVVTKSYNE